MRTAPKITVKEVAYHRNGVCGEGFHAIYFIDHENHGKNNKGGEFVGIVFDGQGQCAVIQLNQPTFTVKFGHNSWRGDQYEPQLRKAIETMPSSGSVRVGPFAIPTE